MVLIAVLAPVALPGSAGSRGPSLDNPIDARLFRGVDVASVRGTETTIAAPDSAYRSNGSLESDSVLLDPDARPVPSARPAATAIQPPAPRGVIVLPSWHRDGNISWYGPGFYGKRTACGQPMTERLRGVAHRTLPCGTKITFRNPANGRTITLPVVDRGPYVGGRQWDLTGGACLALGHCYTGAILWTYA